MGDSLSPKPDGKWPFCDRRHPATWRQLLQQSPRRKAAVH